MKKTKIVCIVGATGSGKTSLAINLAKKFNGEIISADSRQIYRRLDIGTNKDLLDYGQVKYHLIDIAPPEERFTVFDWKDQAEQAIDEIVSRGNLPIIVGGTGLYVQALLENFRQTQKAKHITHSHSEKKNKYSRTELENKTLEQLQEIYSNLKNIDSEIDLNNPHRLIRAIEKIQEGTVDFKEKSNYEAIQIAIDLPRPLLYEKIDKNVEKWFEDRFIEEVRGLVDSGINADWLKSIGLNYRLTSEFILNNETDIEKLKQEIKFKTHGYARRQLTWFRRFKDIKWVKNTEKAEDLLKNFLHNIR